MGRLGSALCAPHADLFSNLLGFVSIRSCSIDLPKFSGPSEGMNERGLTVSQQTLRQSVYQDAPAAERGAVLSLCFTDVTAWALGSFATVAELRIALPSVLVVGARDPSIIAPLHWAVDDSEGDHCGWMVYFKLRLAAQPEHRTGARGPTAPYTAQPERWTGTAGTPDRRERPGEPRPEQSLLTVMCRSRCDVCFSTRSAILQ